MALRRRRADSNACSRATRALASFDTRMRGTTKPSSSPLATPSKCHTAGDAAVRSPEIVAADGDAPPVRIAEVERVCRLRFDGEPGCRELGSPPLFVVLR